MKNLIPLFFLVATTAFGAAGDVIFKQINPSGTAITDRVLANPSAIRVYGLNSSAGTWRPTQFALGTGFSVAGAFGSQTLNFSDPGGPYQPLDTDLTVIAGLTPSNNDVLQRKSGAWANRTLTQYWTDLMADPGPGSYSYTALPFTINTDKRLIGRDNAIPPGVAQEISIGTSLSLSSSSLNTIQDIRTTATAFQVAGLGVGAPPTLTTISSSVPPIQNAGTSIAGYGIWMYNATAASQPAFYINKSANGTLGVQGAVASGDRIGALIWAGSDGTNFIQAAQIRAEVNAAVSTGVVPGQFNFLVANGAGSLTSAGLMTATGFQGAVGATTPSTVASTTFQATTSVLQGGGMKHQRVTTGSISAGSTALVTLTWSSAFSDANVTVTASVVDSTGSSLSLSVVHVESITASAVAVRVINNAAGSLTGVLHVIAMHD